MTANGGRVRLTRNIASITMDFNDIESSVIRSLGGADQVTVGDLSGTDLKTADVDLAAFGGGGGNSADTVIVNGREKPDNVDVDARPASRSWSAASRPSRGSAAARASTTRCGSTRSAARIRSPSIPTQSS